MAVKPTDNPEIWADAGNYPPSVYPATFPWGDAHPEAGNPTPWSGQPRKNAAGLAGFASTGAVPLQAQAADIWNEEYARVVDLARWTFLGRSTADEEAFLVETDSDGQVNLARGLFGGNTAAIPGLRVVTTTGATSMTVTAGTEQAASITNNSGANPALMLNNAGAGLDLDTSGTARFQGIVTLAAGANLQGNEIEGTAGSVVDVETVEVTTIAYDDSTTTLPTNGGEVRWNNTFFSLRDDAGQARTFDEPQRGYDASFSTASAIADTGASATRRIKQNEGVWVEMSARWEIDTATSNMNLRLEIVGPLGTVEPLISTYRTETANVGYALHRVFFWTPTDDFVAVSTENYVFTVRMGASAGTITAVDVGLKVSSAVQA